MGWIGGSWFSRLSCYAYYKFNIFGRKNWQFNNNVLKACETVSSRLMTKPTKWLCSQQRLRSAWAFTQSDQSSLCAQWVAKDPRFLHVDSEDWSDWEDAQADLSLRWAHSHLLVLSCGSSFLTSSNTVRYFDICLSSTAVSWVVMGKAVS